MGWTLSFLETFLPCILLLLFSVSLVSFFYWCRNSLSFLSFSFFAMLHLYFACRIFMFMIELPFPFVIFLYFFVFFVEVSSVYRDGIDLHYKTNHTKQYKSYMQTNMCVHMRTYMQTFNYTCKQTDKQTYKQACLLFPLRLI